MLDVARLYFQRAKADSPTPVFLLENLRELMKWPLSEPPHPRRLAEAIGFQVRARPLSGFGELEGRNRRRVDPG